MPFNIRSSGSYYVIFDDSKLSSDKTYTLPDQSGYLVASDTPGTSSYSLTSSYATTASYALSGVGGAGVTIGGPTTTDWSQYGGTPNRYMLVSDGVTNDITASHLIQLDTSNESINIYAGIEGYNDAYIALSPNAYVSAGNFIGTASLATTASYSSTASYVLGGAGATVTNAADNRVITSTGTSTGLNGESNLTFDGTILTVTGNATVTDTFRAGDSISDNHYMTGSLYLSGSIITPTFVDYEEKYTSPVIGTPTAGTLTLDLRNGNIFNVTINLASTAMVINNPPAADSVGSFVLVTTGNGTTYPFTWAASISWPGGVTPTITSTNGKKDVYAFISLNQGTNWYGFIGGQNI